MRVTYILKNLTESAHEELAAMPDAERFARLTKWAFGDLKHCVSQKVGTGQFRDRVELNGLFRNREASFTYKIEPRKGYKLATFDVT